MSEELYYLQDSRGYCGNDVLWWALNGNGYTTDLSKAHIFTRTEALSQNRCRETDIPWQKDYIDGKTRHAVDMQYIRIEEALAGTGIELRKPEKPKKRRHEYRCDCGKFVTEREFYERIYHGFVCRRCEGKS